MANLHVSIGNSIILIIIELNLYTKIFFFYSLIIAFIAIFRKPCNVYRLIQGHLKDIWGPRTQFGLESCTFSSSGGKVRKGSGQSIPFREDFEALKIQERQNPA